LTVKPSYGSIYEENKKSKSNKTELEILLFLLFLLKMGPSLQFLQFPSSFEPYQSERCSSKRELPHQSDSKCGFVLVP